MADPTVHRRLAAILAADVVTYSRLMGLDEAGTHAAWKSYRRDLIDPTIAEHEGRIVKLTGDGFLVEFPSVVNAVACAATVQYGMQERNEAVPQDRRIEVRIGINLGDVIVEGDDLYGDGVNIAARLQGLADPGGILISGTVFDQVKDKLTLGFDYLGPQAVKNIAAQVPIYRVLLQPGATAPADHRDAAVPGTADGAPERDRRWHRFYVSAAYAGAVIALLVAINLFSWDGDPWFRWPTLGILFFLMLRAIQIFRR
jgi:class 3 adenylate cyclase